MKIKLLIFSLLLSVLSWGQTITITNATIGGSGVLGSNNYNAGAERAWAQSSVSFGGKAITCNPAGTPASSTACQYIQAQANNGVIYNTTAFPGRILSVQFTGSATVASTLYLGTSRLVTSTTADYATTGTSFGAQTNTTYTWTMGASDNYTFFCIKRGGTAQYFSSIVITYETATPHTVTFNGNGSDGGSMTNQTASSTTALTTNAFTRTGYTFTGWNTAANGSGTSYTDGQSYNFSADITLYAQWLSSGCTAPGTQSSALSYSNSTLSGFDVNWTAGTGNGTMVVVRENALANALPVSGTSYVPNLNWASAGQINTNNRVIFRAAGSSAAPITGLNPGTEYRVTAYEYNTTGNCYNLSSPASTVAYTMSAEPTAHAASFTCTTISSSQIDLSFSAANTITNGRGYLILRKIGSVPTGIPTDGILYTPGATIGDATVVGMTSLAGTDTSFSVTGLTSNTNYYFVLIPLNSYLSVPETINYRVSATIPSTNCTTTTAPCLSESFAVNALPSSWLQTSVTFVTNRAEFSSNNGELTTVSVSNPTSLAFTLERTASAVAKTMLVEVSTTSQSSGFTTIATYDHSNTTSGGTINATVDLTPYSGFSTVYIKFRKSSASSVARWGLDNIAVTCGPPPPPCATPTAQPTGLGFSSVTGAAFNGSFTAASPVPTGYLVIYSTNATLSAGDLPVSGTTYAAGNTLGDGTVAYVGTGTSFSVSGLTSATTYYVFVFSYNSGACAIAYNTASPLSGSTTTAIAYCTSNGNTTYQTSLTNVTLNTINNTSAKPSGYSDYTAISTNLQKGVSYPLSARINTDGNYTVLSFAWIDFNHDGDFTDVGEAFDLGSATNTANGLSSSSPLTISVPLTATVGATRMRVIATYDGDSSPCLTGFDGEVEDYTVNIIGSCVPTHTVASFAPTSGPTSTDVTITGTGFTATSTVAFNGINATVVFVNSTTLIATVPTGVTTGNVTVTEGGCNVISEVFTQIKNAGTCANGNNLTDLIISEVFDSLAANSWYMELYNPTSNPINLNAAGANYKLVRYGDIGTTNGIRTVDISGVIPAGGIYLADLGTESDCGSLGFDFTAKANGINENDEIRLTKNDITVDIVHCPNEKGYSILRNVTAVGPSATYNAADWTTNLNESCANLDTVPFGFSNNTPAVNANPADVVACGSTANFAITATAGSGALTYQWYYNNGVTVGWTTVTTLAGLTITGQTSNSLNLSGAVSIYGGYQFYCQVTEGAACSVASDAAQLTVISTTWNGTAWSNGAPAIGKLVIINGNYNTTTNGDFDACSLVVNPTFTATVTPNHYINIQNNLTVNGILDVQDNGSLIQISDAGVNTGNIFMKRIATMKLLDYVFWSSPVANFAANAISPTTPTNLIWKWNPSVANTNNGFGNWQNANEIMSIGKGYIVRGPSGFDNATAQDFTANFVGVPNNGIKDVNIERGNYTGVDYAGTNGALITKNEDNWNLIGNPYPSAINAKDFMTLNANIEGSVRLWTHGTLPNTSAANPFYNSYAYNYSATDYLIYNLTGTQTQAGFDGYIGAGQSFFVLMNDGAAATETVRFQNSLRSKGYRNDQFYKNAGSQNATNDIERHRIWVDLISSTGTVNRTLVGYIEGATQDKDRLYDAYSDHKSAQDFYSVLNNESLVIQGRALPFADSDLVPMGVKIPTNGTYTIAIAAVDGLFSGNTQAIYLEDKVLNTIHNLSVAPYQFTAAKGIVDNRFVIRYTDQALGNEDFDLTNNNLKIYPSNDEIKIYSSIETIQNYTVYDVLGRVLAEKNNVNSKQSVVSSVLKNNQALIVKITLENGQIVTRKMIF